MLFSWDPVKAKQNIIKHGISFELAQGIFEDPFQLSVLDKKTRHEERWITIGKNLFGKILTLVHTYSLDEQQ